VNRSRSSFSDEPALMNRQGMFTSNLAAVEQTLSYSAYNTAVVDSELFFHKMRQPLLDHASPSSVGTSGRSSFTDAGLFSIITFSWMGPLLDLGRRKTLDLEDVPLLGDSDSVHGIVHNFRERIHSISTAGQCTGVTTIKLSKALVFTTCKLILVTAVYALFRTVASYVGPYLIEYFVEYLNRSSRSNKQGYLLVLTFVVAQLIEALSSRHFLFRSKQLGLRVRSALVGIIYQKGLALSSQSRQGNSSGEMINVFCEP
jgi:hypothetical protein